MTTEMLRPGPDPEAITRTIRERYPDTDVVEAYAATFFSVDAEKHWPNFATIVTTDEHDEGAPSNLTARPGVFRLNIGVSGQTFERLVDARDEPDYAAFDRILPHPVYAKQLWISILNPSDEMFRDVVLPLLDEAHERVASVRARHAAAE
ncbi:MAG: DUF6194 family protein [Chloroflexota bacterium]